MLLAILSSGATRGRRQLREIAMFHSLCATRVSAPDRKKAAALTVRVLVATTTVLLSIVATSARADTDWMGSVDEWAVGYDASSAKPFCRLYWDSLTGKTTEFRISSEDAVWLVGKTTWSIPDDLKTKVKFIGHDRSFTIAAQAYDAHNLRLWSNPEDDSSAYVKNLLTKAFLGTPDISLDFSGTEEDWSLPISYLKAIYPAFANCMKRLNGHLETSTSSDASSPF
jgi:hypothetical protein